MPRLYWSYSAVPELRQLPMQERRLLVSKCQWQAIITIESIMGWIVFAALMLAALIVRGHNFLAMGPHDSLVNELTGWLLPGLIAVAGGIFWQQCAVRGFRRCVRRHLDESMG